MITRNTVLVLGAGASMDYGFPSGEALVDNIVRGLTSGPQRDILAEMLRQNYFAEHVIDDFVNDLKLAGRTSIDAFLEHRPELIEFGKMAIATSLIPYEKEESLFQARPSWYSYLFNQLNAKYEEFSQNRLAVVTFNYDRSLEHYLHTALQHAYSKKPREEIIEKVKSIPVIHLHGSLGDLPYFGPRPRQYVPTLDPSNIHSATSSIRVIHEDLSKEPQFDQAKKLIQSAEVIGFLGFGWNEVNLDRLDVQMHNALTKVCGVYGTVFGKGHAEIEWVRRYFLGPVTLDQSRIFEFLRDHPILIEYPDPVRDYGKKHK